MKDIRKETCRLNNNNNNKEAFTIKTARKIGLRAFGLYEAKAGMQGKFGKKQGCQVLKNYKTKFVQTHCQERQNDQKWKEGQVQA